MNHHPSDFLPTDKNLLFGILALESEFIEQDAMVAAMRTLAHERNRPLAQILCEQGKVSLERRLMIEALVEEKLAGETDNSCMGNGSTTPRLPSELLLAGRSSDSANGKRRTAMTDTRAVPVRDYDVQRYRILRPHAKGGLGEIFVAADQELDREVALKEIQSEHAHDPGFRSRFVREAKITGGLEHPGIVPIYSLGSHVDGRPYYAMRFVKGVNLTEAIEHFHQADTPMRKTADKTLEFRQLLRRFTDMCNAVAFAHSRGVLHRDLKPGNVMLGGFGETLIVDWGLAKAAGENSEFRIQNSEFQSSTDVIETQPGAAVGTPAYMSPEQAAGETDRVGPATDIYGLGATLYAVLTGQSPFTSADRAELLNRVQKGEFPRPREIKKDVPAALEAICLKAMALQPADRYASALDLAADVEHWLADEPVAAYREPWRERTRRFLRKHRTLATSAAAMLVVAALLSSGAAVLLNVARAGERQARFDEVKQKEAAIAAQNQADAVANFLVDAFRSPDPSRDGKEIKVVEMLDRAVEKVDQEFADDPVIRGRLLDALGNTYLGLGLPGRAVKLLKQAVEIRSERFGRDHSDTHLSMVNLAEAFRDAGLHADALPLREEILRLRRATLGDHHQATFDATGSLAHAYWAMGRTRDAIPLYAQTLKQITDEQLDHSDPDAHLIMNNLAVAYAETGRRDEALPLFERTLRLRRTVLGPDHPHTLISMNNLATAYRRADRLADAIPLAEEALRLRQNSLGLEHPDTLYSMIVLGQTYFQAARPLEAVAIREKAKPLAATKLGADHPHTVQLTADLATTYWELGRRSEAVPLMEEAVRLTRNKHGADHPLTLRATTNLATMYSEARRLKEAVPIFEDALARWRRVHPDNPDVAWTLFGFGLSLNRQMEFGQAEQAFREALATLEKKRPDDRLRFSVQIKLGQALAGQHKFADAEPLLLAGYEGLQAQQKLRQSAQLHVKEAVQCLVKLYEATERHEKAAEWRGKETPPDSHK